jgi:proteic killer suppression protein
MIKEFADKETKALWEGKRSRIPASIHARALAKLQQLHAAPNLEFLRQPPGNRLEPLQGDRAGQHSIRINGQWRVCFFWDVAGARAVEITDYH